MPKAPTARRILLIRPSALGDVCRSVPVLASLRRAFPEATIDWVVRDSFVDAVRAHPGLSEVIPFPRGRWSHWWRPAVIGDFRRWCRDLAARRYDLVIDAQGLSRSGIIAASTRAARRIGYERASELAWLGYNERYRRRSGRHAVDDMLDLIEQAGIEPVHDMRLYVHDDDSAAWRTRQDEAGLDGPYAVLAPTARWETKRWPIERWRELAAAIAERGLTRFVVIGAPGEEAQVAPLTNTLGGGIDLVGQTSVGETMAVIAHAALVVANDSAPLHMAVGFDRPCVGLFGPTDPDIVGPYRRPETVVRSAHHENVHYRDRGLGDRLMREISVADVVARVDDVMGRTGSAPPGSNEPMPVWLASGSPRRRELLAEAQVEVKVMPAGVDDGLLQRGCVSAREWVVALAYLKARWVVDALASQNGDAGPAGGGGLVLGADTVCAVGDRVLGQPATEAEARAMLESMIGRSHETLTGVCLIDRASRRRWFLLDHAVVTIGDVPEHELQAYLASGEWKGKAGGYNLADRVAAGWPITCEGDPTTVMGLPLQRLGPWLERVRETTA